MNLADIAAGVRARTPAWVARAITLIESTRPDHQDLAQQLLADLTPDSGRSHRIGISGVPGAGKSTFIDTLGSDLTAAGHRVAVLAVDPSSSRSGGSILGDKTRMTRLAADPSAFIRPSPTSGTLGGVAKTTREAIVVVEAAGYDVVIVETVGVGQSETTVAGMVDTFLFLTLARTGDQLQGIKKGILEVADVIAVNKADGPHADEARRAARDLAGALRFMDSATPVLTCSALEHTGVDEVWKQVCAHLSRTDVTARRRAQQVDWTFAMAREAVLRRFENDPAVRSESATVRERVRDGSLTPAQGAQRLLDAYRNIC